MKKHLKKILSFGVTLSIFGLLVTVTSISVEAFGVISVVAKIDNVTPKDKIFLRCFFIFSPPSLFLLHLVILTWVFDGIRSITLHIFSYTEEFQNLAIFAI